MALRRRPDDQAIGTGPAGDVPYDQSDIQEDPLGGMDPTAPPAGAGQPDQPVPDAPMGVDQGAGPQDTGDLSNDDLAALDATPEDQMLADLQDALQDPDPNVRAQAEAQLALAARRGLLGGGGQ